MVAEYVNVPFGETIRHVRPTRVTSAPSPETTLMLLAARISPSDHDRDAMRELVRGGVEWRPLIDLAVHHHVTPMVRHNLVSVDWADVPGWVRQDLDSRYAINTRRALYLSSTLLEIVRLLDAAGVPSIALKGPILALTAYGDVALRQTGDLDLLVPYQDVARATGALLSAGFEPDSNLPGEAFRWMSELRFLRPRDGVNVDLHWNATIPVFSLPFEHEALRRFSRPLLLGGVPVNTLTPEMLFLLLCVHGAAHGWERLRWVCDIDALSRRALDWAWIVPEASRLRIERMLALALVLAHDLLDTPYPEDVSRRLPLDATPHRLAASARSRLLNPAPVTASVLEMVTFWLRARESARDRVRFTYRVLADPRPHDWEAVKLPVRFRALYRVVRPVRLTYRAGMAGTRKLLGTGSDQARPAADQVETV